MRPSRYGTRTAAVIAQEVISNIMSINDEGLTNGHRTSDANSDNSGKSFKSLIAKKELNASTVNTTSSTSVSSNDCDHTKSSMSLNSSQNIDTNLIFSGPMYEAYQTWALKTYGDSAKTKTVTQKKYNRIVKILKGEENSCVENSKFRFWVKAKGFKLGTSDLGKYSQADVKEEQVLLVPCNKAPGNTSVNNSNSGQCKNDDIIYKRVAVVENFYQIIYIVHVEMDGRSGKHAGQKRTYRAVAEMYAFLPREAVTRFLMSCSDCQKRMHLQGLTTNETENTASHLINSNSKKSSSNSRRSNLHTHDGKGKTTAHIEEEMDYNLPITTTYLKRMKSLGYNNYSNDHYSSDTNRIDLHSNLIIAGSVEDQELDEIGIVSETASDQNSHSVHGNQTSDLEDLADGHCAEGNKRSIAHKLIVETDAEPDSLAEDEVEMIDSCIPLDMSKMRTTFEISEEVGNLSSKLSSKGLKRKRDLSPKYLKSNSDLSELNKLHAAENESSHDPNSFIKEEDEEDEDEEENDAQSNDRIEPANPEKLKAFNMFVRLFVDENLDRMVPISKQPKDKIQAIIDSCTRQFPEFSERARKRIRTYLKSCRRTRRNKAAIASSLNGKDGGQETETKTQTSSYHLASAMAEQILATACKNEYKNAKRMRIGLKPIAVNVNEANESLNAILSCSASPSSDVEASLVKPNATSSSNSNLLAMLTGQSRMNGEPTYKSDSNKLNDTSSAFKSQASRENRSNRFSSINFGNNQLHHTFKYSLNPEEMAAVKQLISGYRESAAFLLRSALELEHLLLQQT